MLYEHTREMQSLLKAALKLFLIPLHEDFVLGIERGVGVREMVGTAGRTVTVEDRWGVGGVGYFGGIEVTANSLISMLPEKAEEAANETLLSSKVASETKIGRFEIG
jgi:zinc transporter ZupT